LISTVSTKSSRFQPQKKGFTTSCSGYITQDRVLFVLDGAYGDNGDPTNTNLTRSGLRKSGFDTEWPPKGGKYTCYNCYTNACTCRDQTYYPPEAIPAVSFADLGGSANLEMVFGFGDGALSSYDASANSYFSFNFASSAGINPQTHAIDASEATIADLNGDGVPEVIFTTYGYPTKPPSSENNQHLYILSNTGQLLHDIPLNTAAAGGGDTSYNGNGNGAAGAPTIADVDGDGQLEITLHTFDGRILIYTVPGSSTNCLAWPTGRGGYMRKGQPDYAQNA